MNRFTSPILAVKARFAAVVAVALAVVLAATLTASSDPIPVGPTSTGEITGCYRTINGDLRLVNLEVDTCYEDEQGIGWYDSGYPLSMYDPRVEVSQAAVGSGQTVTHETECDDGWMAISGGFATNVAGGQMATATSRPTFEDDSPVGWEATVTNPAGSAGTLDVFVYCVTLVTY